MIFDFLDTLLQFPSEFQFLQYLLGGVIIIIFTTIIMSFFISVFLAIFRK